MTDYCDNPAEHGCGRAQAPGYPKPTVKVDLPSPPFYANIRGSGVTHPWGVATYPINSPADVQVDLDSGCLVIRMAAHEKRVGGEVKQIAATSIVYNARSWDRFDVRPVKPKTRVIVEHARDTRGCFE